MAAAMLVHDQEPDKRGANNAPLDPPPQTSALLRLPAELRNQIYGLVFPPNQVLEIFTHERYAFHPVQTNRRHDADWSRNITRTFTFAHAHDGDVCPDCPAAGGTYIWHMTSLSRVCRQVRAESLRFYYGYNHFVLALSLPDLPRTIRWLESRPEEFYKVVKGVYLHQHIRRCSSRTASTRPRLLFTDLQTLECEVIPMEGVHDGCVKRYVERLERKKGRSEFGALRTEVLKGKVGRDAMVRMVEVMQHGAKRREVLEMERELWGVLPFGPE